MYDHNIQILTAHGQAQQVTSALHDYICLTSDRRVYYNEAYKDHPQILNKLAYYRAAGLFDGQPIAVSTKELRDFYEQNSKNTQESSQLQREASDLFKLAASRNASDVHINVRRNECIIKIRTIGNLDIVHEYTFNHGHALCKTIFMTMCDQAGKTFQPKSRQDARMKAIFLPNSITGVRIGTSPTDSGYIMVCRLLKKADANTLNLTHLGFADWQIAALDQARSKKGGINIFAGPTGSGKSTTMATIISMIISASNGRKHVITVENPVEYDIWGQITIKKNIDGKLLTRTLKSYATQTPVMAPSVKRKKEIFSEAIIALMRLDPDVAMIGEIRDSGSLKAAIDAAMTGHQVWTSVHATTAIGIIKRLLTAANDEVTSIDKALVCDAHIVSSLIAQRLVKTLCEHCKQPLQNNVAADSTLAIHPWLLKRLRQVYKGDLSGINIRNPRGCQYCLHGNNGRTVIAEIINCNQQFMDLMLQSHYLAEQYWLKELKGVPMMAHGLLNVKRGIIDPADLEEELEYIKLPDGIDMAHYQQLFYNNNKI